MTRQLTADLKRAWESAGIIKPALDYMYAYRQHLSVADELPMNQCAKALERAEAAAALLVARIEMRMPRKAAINDAGGAKSDLETSAASETV